jgi:hypothetical protein
MAWQPPEDELDSNVLQQWKPPEDELDENISNQWSPPEDELDNSPKKIKDVGTLNQMKASGQELTREQERILWDADERKPLTQKASEAITSFFPAAIDIAKQAGAGTAEFVYDVILNPLDTMSQSPEEAAKTLNTAKNTLRSFAVGVSRDIQETADLAVRFGMFGSAFTDKLLGRTDDERFERYMLRESMRQFSQKVYEDNPDHAARLLAENPILQKMAYAAALAQGATPEEAELAKKAYSELVLESGLTKDEINENVATLAEIMSPIALPGTNRITNAFGKATGKVTQKAGELALKGVVAPVARGVAKTAGKVEAGAEKVQQLSRKIGEYAVGDPDTLVKNAANTAMMPIRIPAKTTGGIAKTVADVAGEAGYGRRGMFERAGRKADAGELTKRLFGPEALGGKGRARMADWAVRQTNAIVQPAVNGSIINIVMGLPDIESGADLGFMAGTGAGIGAFGGSRFQDRAMALVDPTTSLAQKIDAIVTPDPAAYRKDQDADIKRFLATADTSLLDSINELSNIDNIKSALDVKIKNLEGKKIAQIRDEDAQRIQENIDLLSKQREELDKTTPQTEAEIKRQIQLSFADAMDLAKTTGAAAGLNNIEVKVLKPEQMEDFYRERYGKNLIDAEAVRRELIGNPTLSPSEQELLTKADETILRFLNDLAGASNARGFAVAERPDMPGQKGATIVINGDLVTQMGRDGLNISRVINHEMQHALANFTEVRQMLAPLRQELFDQKIQNPDGSFEFVSKGMISDAQLDAYALQYAAGMDASGGTSFLSHFADQNQVREYMKEEVLSELAGLSGASHGDIRAGLDSVGRQAVDWLETKTRSGALKRIKEGLRQFGVLVDDQGQFTSVLGANFSPEALAMMRQYQRKLRDLNESLVYNSDPRKDEPAIPITELATNRAFQQRYKDSEFFEQEQVISMQAPDGSKQEIPVPVNAELNPLVGSYTFADGQLVDDSGNVVSFGPDVALQAMPDGTVVTLDTRVARNPNGSPRILSPHETKRRAKERGNAIREVIDNAPDDGSGVRLEDTGNGNYRGTLSPTQIAAINALPNDVVAPSLKRKIAFFNDILGRKDGTIVEIEYQAALRDGKYRALKPQLRTEIPIGFQFDKQGNFLMTTMSISRMYDKANAWAAKSPRNLRLWGGDMTKFWDSVRQYTLNHQEGVQGHIGLHSDPYIAMRMKNRINDLFNVYRKETREANPERTTLPKRRGQDSRDVIIRSRRMDRVNSYDETALAKMPFQYELAVQNYLPAENSLADFQSAEQFAKATEVDQNLVNRAIAGDIESLEVELSNEDVLRPMEYVDVNDNKIRIRSMFDPTQGFLLEPQESAPEMPAVQFMPAVAVVPERFTGKPEDERRGRYVAPPSFFQKFDIGEYERGGKFFDLETGEEITDKIYQTGTIDVSGKSPKLVSEQSAEDLGDGKTYKTNLFKKSAGWEWISENPPEVASIGKNPVLISVEGGKEHKYALKVDFTNGVQLKRYADKPSEPRLRPTGKGDLNLGNVVGEIDIRGKQHPVYDSITIGTQFMPAVTEVETSFSDLSKEPVTTITETDGISRTLPFDSTGRMDEFSDRPETEPQQSADSTSSVDAGKITPAEKAFDNIKYAPARAWGVQSLADRFDRFRVSIGNEAIQPPIYRKDFAKHETEFRQAAQIAEQIYRSTLSNVDAAYASNRGTADRLLPRLPEVQSLFTDSDGRVKFLNSTPINITRGDILFMPAEVDARYIDLEAKAKAGDKEAEAEAQRMVDEAAKQAGGIVAFHGSPKGIQSNVLSRDFANRGNIAGVIYLTDSKRGAWWYATHGGIGKYIPKQKRQSERSDLTPQLSRFYYFTKNPLTSGGIDVNVLFDVVNKLKAVDAYLQGEWNTEYLDDGTDVLKYVVNDKSYDSKKEAWDDNIADILQNGDFAGNDTEALPPDLQVLFSLWEVGDAYLKEKQHDAVIYRDNEISGQINQDANTIVPIESSQVKSADPFTYDDAGNLIPLSQRFQTATSDIRFLPTEQGAEPEGLQGIELPTQYRRISDMIPPLRDIEPPVRPVQALPAEERMAIDQSAKFDNAVIFNPGIQFLPAYHGTKAKIPKEDGFQLKFVGTGLGKQAWGWGLYFGTNESIVNKSYPSQFRYKVDLDMNPEDALDYEASIDPRLLESDLVFAEDLKTNGDYYEALSEMLGSDKDASLALLNIGIPALKYLDGKSRSKNVRPEDKTYNYVVFDESKIKIVDEQSNVVGPAIQFLPKSVERTMQKDAGDFSVVIGGKPGRYGFGFTTVAELQPKQESAEQRKERLLSYLDPNLPNLNAKKDALVEIGKAWWAMQDVDPKTRPLKKEDAETYENNKKLLEDFEKIPDKEFTLRDAIRMVEVDRSIKAINDAKLGMTPPPFKFPVGRTVLVPDLQSTLTTIFKSKKFKEFIVDAAGLQGINFDNILGTWKFEVEPSFVFNAPGMTWDQAQTVTKWLSFLMTQDAGIAWKPSIGLAKGAPAVYLVNDKKLTEEQIKNAFVKAKEVGIDGLSLTVDGKGIKAANFDKIKDFESKLIEIQKAANIKNFHNTLVDSFYYDTTSDFTAEDGSIKVPDWLIAGQTTGQTNETDLQDQQGGVGQEMREGGGNSATGGLSVLLRRGIDSVLVPYAKALAGQGFTFDPVKFAERYGLGQAVADYIREQLYPATGLSRSVTPILEGTEKFIVPESKYTSEGKLKTDVNNLLYALQKRSADDGFILPGDYSPRAGQIISETIVDEVLGHIDRAKQDPNAPNAIGWYDTALKEMKARYAKFFPFLDRKSKSYDADKEFIFDAILGITSQGNNVFENGKMAARMQFMLENGRTLPELVEEDIGPLYGTFGGQTRAIENNFLKLHELIQNNDIKKLDKIFRKKMSVSKWNAYLKQNKNLWFNGKPLTIDGQADQMVTGFSVFGPKIGSFINNLHGDYSTLTADLWYTRTWNRILGNVFQHAPLKEANQYETFRNALLEQYRSDVAKAKGEKFEPLLKKIKEKDGEKVYEYFEYYDELELTEKTQEEIQDMLNDPDAMLDFATKLEDRFRGGQYKEKSDLRRAAKNWIENRVDPVAAPRTDLERDFQQSVMELAQKKLRRKGIDITIADMQAALWYNEKELFGLYGAQVSGAEPASYADAAENVEELLDYGTLFQLERQIEQEDGTKKKEIIRLVPYDTEVGLTKVSNPKSPKDYADLVALRKKTKEDAKKKAKALEKAELKVEKTKRELSDVNPENEKAKQKLAVALAKAEKLLSDLKPPVVGSDAPLTELKSPVE